MSRKFFGGKKKNPNINTKSIFFYSYKLNKEKFNVVEDYAQLIQDTKNHLSKYVKDNLILKLFNELDLKTFIKLTKPYNVYAIGSSFYQQVQKEVYTRYKTQLNAIEFRNKHLKNTELSTTVQYLVKVYKGDKDYVINHLSQGNKIYHLKVLNIINKYGIRLWNLVIQIQQRLIKNFKTVNFKTLCFNGINQLSINKKLNFIEFNPDIKIANTVINLNIPNSGVIAIPTLFNKDYHKNLDYQQSFTGLPKSRQTQTSYQCKIVNNRVKVIITREENKHNFSIIKESILGLDLNTGRNLFSLSDEHIILYDNWIIDKFKKLQKHITKKQKIKQQEKRELLTIQSKIKNSDKDSKVYLKKIKFKLENVKKYSKKTNKRIEKMNRRSIYYNNLKARELVNYCIVKGYNHIVMEDLNLQSCKGEWSYKYGINFNDIAKILHLNDFKNTIKRIANKFGIAVSFTNPDYTSQTCSKCGYIHKSNRAHEMFSCKQCNHTLDADYNAALNIRDRILIPLLRDTLHDINKDKENNLCLHYVGKKYISRNTYVTTYNTLHGNTIPNNICNSKKKKSQKKVLKNTII